MDDIRAISVTEYDGYVFLADERWPSRTAVSVGLFEKSIPGYLSKTPAGFNIDLENGAASYIETGRDDYKGIIYGSLAWSEGPEPNLNA